MGMRFAIVCCVVLLTTGAAPGWRAPRYGAQCWRSSELLGHPVPPYVDLHITNMFPLALQSDATNQLVGYLYTTLEGRAYFVASRSAYERGITRWSDNTSFLVGSNADAVRLSPSVRARIAMDMKSPTPLRFLISQKDEGPACFTSDWRP